MDPELIARAKRGDKEAFTALVLRFGDRLYSVAFRISGSGLAVEQRCGPD